MLQLPLYLLVLILKGKNTGSSPLRLTICALVLHFWLLIETQFSEFTPVKNAKLVKKHRLISVNILFYTVLEHKIIMKGWYIFIYISKNGIVIDTKFINIFI